MDLRALRTFRFGSTNIRRGMPVTMTEARGKEHVARGFAEEVKAPASKKGADPKKDSAAKADAEKAD